MNRGRAHALGDIAPDAHGASTESLVRELRGHGFRKLGLWPRGGATALFDPARALLLELERADAEQPPVDRAEDGQVAAVAVAGLK